MVQESRMVFYKGQSVLEIFKMQGEFTFDAGYFVII